MTTLSEQELIRLVVAAFLGAIIGFERERGDRAAGLRTHALVATASALIMIVSAYGFASVVTAGRTVVADPSRIAAQVVSGIGFLGAGTIILRKDTVRGLTTAASIWMVAGIGLACGVGMYLPAAATTLIALGILSGLKLVEERVFAHKRVTEVTLYVRRRQGQMAAIEERMARSGVTLRRLQLQPGRANGDSAIKLELTGAQPDELSSLVQNLGDIPGVKLVSYGGREAQGSAAEAASAR